MDINSESVKNGLNSLNQVDIKIKEARRFINEGSASLDSRISNPYGYLKELLKKIELRENDIVSLCKDFINEVNKTYEKINSVEANIPGEFSVTTVLNISQTTTSLDSGGETVIENQEEDLNPHDNSDVSGNNHETIIGLTQENGKNINGATGENDHTTMESINEELNPDLLKELEELGRKDEEKKAKDKDNEQGQLLADEVYQEIEDSLADFLMQEEITEEDLINYIKGMTESSKYISDEDKNYIYAQLEKGNIRSAYGKVLAVQKKQEIDAKIEELKKSEAYQRVIKYKEEAEAYRNAARLSINSKEQMDLWALQRKAEYDGAIAEGSPEYKKILALIAAEEAQLKEYEKSRKIWEYDYILKEEKDVSIEEVKKYFEDLAVEAEEYASNPSINPNYSIALFQNAKKYRDLNIILSDDELKIYWYLCNNASKEEAKEYFDLLESKINSYYGMQIAEESFKNIITANGKGDFLGVLTADLEGVGIGTKEWFEVVGNLFSKTGTMTPSEYAVLYINSMLGSTSYFIPLSKDDLKALKEEGMMTLNTYNILMEKILNKDTITYLDVLYANEDITLHEYEEFKAFGEDDNIKEFIKNNNSDEGFMGKSHLEWLKSFFNIGVTTGNMLPSVVASVLSYGAASGMGVAAATANTISKYAGLATMYMYCLSADKNAALREGRSEISAWIHGILSATGEVGTELLFDKIFNFIPGLPDFGMASSTTKMKTLGKILFRLFILAPAGEITEEMVQYALFDPLANLLAYGDDEFKFEFNTALEIALTTYVSTFQLQFGSTIISSPSTIKKSGVLFKVTGVDGKVYKFTYSDLEGCFDETTAKINQDKLFDAIAKKTGKIINVDGIDIGITFDEINSCTNPNTGKINRTKLDKIIKSKLDAIKSQDNIGIALQSVDIEYENSLTSILDANKNYADVTEHYLKEHNYTFSKNTYVVWDSEQECYLLIKDTGEVLRNLTKYEQFTNNSDVEDVTEILRGKVDGDENQYILYNKKVNKLYLVNLDGEVTEINTRFVEDAARTLSLLENNPNYKVATIEFLNEHNIDIPKASVVIYNSESDQYILLNEEGKPVKNLTIYEKYMNIDGILDITDKVSGDIVVNDNEYLIYDSIYNKLYKIIINESMENNVESLGDFEFKFEESDIVTVDDVQSQQEALVKKDAFAALLKRFLYKYNVTIQDINEALEKIHFHTQEDFVKLAIERGYTLEEANLLLGINERATHIIHMAINPNVFNQAITYYHEVFHSFGRILESFFTESHGGVLGINEIITEYLALDAAMYINNFKLVDYYNQSSCSYKTGAVLLKLITYLDVPGINFEEITDAYFNTHDMSKLYNAFDEALRGSKYTAYDFFSALTTTAENSDAAAIVEAKQRLWDIYDTIKAKYEFNVTLDGTTVKIIPDKVQYNLDTSEMNLLDDEVTRKFGVTLSEGEQFFYDPKTDSYFITHGDLSVNIPARVFRGGDVSVTSVASVNGTQLTSYIEGTIKSNNIEGGLFIPSNVVDINTGNTISSTNAKVGDIIEYKNSSNYSFVLEITSIDSSGMITGDMTITTPDGKTSLTTNGKSFFPAMMTKTDIQNAINKANNVAIKNKTSGDLIVQTINYQYKDSSGKTHHIRLLISLDSYGNITSAKPLGDEIMIKRSKNDSISFMRHLLGYINQYKDINTGQMKSQMEGSHVLPSMIVDKNTGLVKSISDVKLGDVIQYVNDEGYTITIRVDKIDSTGMIQGVTDIKSPTGVTAPAKIKTYFPTSWSTEEVQNALQEAYNIVKVKINKGNGNVDQNISYTYTDKNGVTHTMKIHVICNGTAIKTIYPVSQN